MWTLHPQCWSQLIGVGRSRKLTAFASIAIVSLATISDGASLAHIRRRAHTTTVSPHQALTQSAVRAPARQGSNRTLEAVVQAWLNRPELAHSLAGVDVIDIATGTELVSVNGRRRFTPASTAKIFVTACAYERLGPNYVYKTMLASEDEVTGSKIHGDLLVIPSQDPTLERDDLRRLFVSLHDKGIREVDGKLRLTDVAGGGQRFLGEWLSEDFSQDYMPVSSSLVVDRNISSPSVFAKPKFTLNPLASIENALEKTLVQSDLTVGWLHYNKEQKSINVYVRDESKGAMASRAVANPDSYNLALAEEMAKLAGVRIANREIKAKASDTLHILCEHDSEPLSKIIRRTLHESDNLYAQQILRTIGADTDNKIHAPTLEESGLVKEKSWLGSIGVPTQEVILWDGCGLSRKDFVSPYALNMVLKHMSSATSAGYLSLLTPASITPRGSFQFKTGSMDSVRGITGVLEAGDNKHIAITILVNGHNPSVRDLRTSIGALISQVAQANVEIPKSELKPDSKLDPKSGSKADDDIHD